MIGSSDNTKLIANNFVKKYPSKIKFIRNNKPLGLQKIANNILKNANGKYMIRLDADDWLNEIAIFIMVEKLENNLNAGIVYGNYFYTDENGKIIGVETRYELDIEDSAGHLPPHGACTLFRTNALAGGYSEKVDAQDGWDLWYKLYKKIGAISVDLPLFYYRQHSKSLSNDNDNYCLQGQKYSRNSKNKENYKPKVLAVIPVKESYPNLKNVPYQKINGRTLLEIAIENTLNSDQIDQLIVSSESQNVLNFLKN